MTAGRPKLPRELKELKGTVRPHRESGEIVAFDLVLEVSPPKYLNDLQRQIFIEKAEMLINQRVLKLPDVSLLEIYCVALANYFECERKINEEGKTYTDKNGYEQINPLTKLQKQYFEQINKISSQFGMSPTTRLLSKVMENKDPFMKFLEE